VIPINDENPTELTPWMTVVLIVANLLTWFALQGLGTMPALEQSVIAFGTRPCEVTGACPVQGLGGEALITSMFMHGGWGHLLGNMLFLWVFGNNIEDSMGHVRFLCFYLLTGVAAGMAHVFFSPQSGMPAVGASGAISGIMGAYILLYPGARVRTWFPPIFIFRIRAVFFLLLWFVLQLFSGISTLGLPESEAGGVAVWAHIGGFVAGLLLIKVFDRPRLVEAKRHHVQLPPDEVARLQW
jgi:membrane associated rhomboid family serine protease